MKPAFAASVCVVALCAAIAQRADAAPVAKIAGVAAYDDGAPAAGATISLADPETGRFVDLIVAGKDGRFTASVHEGDYALAVATAEGFAWIAKQHLPTEDLVLSLSRKCLHLIGHVDGAPASARVHILHNNRHNIGEVYSAPVGGKGNVTFCLPNGTYRASLGEGALAKEVEIDLPSPASFRLRGFATGDVKHGISPVRGVHAELSAVVDDIIARKASIIGLGEPTHGTAESTTER